MPVAPGGARGRGAAPGDAQHLHPQPAEAGHHQGSQCTVDYMFTFLLFCSFFIFISRIAVLSTVLPMFS